MIDSGNSAPRLRVVVFADSVLAQPAVEALVQGGWLVGLCTSRNGVSGASLRHLARNANIALYEADRGSLTTSVGPWLRERRPDVLLAFAFPYRIPLEMLRMARLGGFNVHGGRLPEYRGPQPVFWQIVNRETEGAVTVHRMDEEFDRGAIVASQPVKIAADDTYGLHMVRLAFAAVAVVDLLLRGLMHYDVNLPAVAQDERRAAYQRRPVRDDLVIRWEEQPGDRIRGLVKAANPWNHGAFTSVRGIDLRLTDVTLHEAAGNGAQPPGTILIADAARGVVVNCCDGSALQLDVISMEEGILPGRALAALGIQAGERLMSLGRQSMPAAAAG